MQSLDCMSYTLFWSISRVYWLWWVKVFCILSTCMYFLLLFFSFSMNNQTISINNSNQNFRILQTWGISITSNFFFVNTLHWCWVEMLLLTLASIESRCFNWSWNPICQYAIAWVGNQILNLFVPFGDQFVGWEIDRHVALAITLVEMFMQELWFSGQGSHVVK